MSARISDELHRLRGTRPTRAAEPRASIAKAGRPKMPFYLSDDEQVCWRQIVKLLTRLRTITPSDAPAIELFAQQKVRHLALLKELKNFGEMVDVTILDASGHPHTKRILNPAGKAATQLENSIRALLDRLGLNPASREKVKPAEPAPPKETVPEGHDPDPILL